MNRNIHPFFFMQKYSLLIFSSIKILTPLTFQENFVIIIIQINRDVLCKSKLGKGEIILVQKIEIESKKNYQPFELIINRDSTIVLQFDQDIWDLDEAQQLVKVWQDAYPNNSIMVTFKGMEIKEVLNGKFL